MIDATTYPNIFYSDHSAADIVDGALKGEALPSGHFAFALERGNSTYLARDPLGCNKLFFGVDRNGDLVVANRVAEVWRRGVPMNAIYSCPPGHVLSVSRNGARKLAGSDLSDLPADHSFDGQLFQREVRATLDQAFQWLAHEFASCQFAVCLSGGLDSSVVASLAKKYLADVIAVSFTYLDQDDLRRHGEGMLAKQLVSASADFKAAAKVAAALAMPLVPVVRSRQAVSEAVRASVELCQDWRDFNVHCATVNLFLAQDLRAAFANRKVVVLTGDLMNEYVCDYNEEKVGDTVYYKIPRIPLGRRRKYFVRGLDAGDREIGVFYSHGLTACQPFATVAALYMHIPDAMLEQSDLKWTLNGALLAPEVVPHVSRAKTRAQVGGSDLGTLGIYHQLGVDEGRLRRAWQEQFPGETPASCDELIQFGRYKLPRFVSDP